MRIHCHHVHFDSLNMAPDESMNTLMHEYLIYLTHNATLGNTNSFPPCSINTSQHFSSIHHPLNLNLDQFTMKAFTFLLVLFLVSTTTFADVAVVEGCRKNCPCRNPPNCGGGATAAFPSATPAAAIPSAMVSAATPGEEDDNN